MADRIDWSKEAEKKEYPVYPAGLYLLEADAYVRGESKRSKSPQIEWSFTIQEEDQDHPLGGGTFVDFFSLSTAALWRIASFVKACGIDMSVLPEMVVTSEEFNRVLDMCKGRKVYANLITEMWEGKERNKVKEYMPYEDQKPAPVWGENQVPDFVKNKVKKAGLA